MTRWYSGSPSCPITKRGSRMSCLPPMRDSRLSTSRSRWVRAHEVQRARRERTKPGDELQSVARREGSPASFRPVRTPSAIPRTPASAPRSELSPSDSTAPRQIWGQPARLSATSGPMWRTNCPRIPRSRAIMTTDDLSASEQARSTSSYIGTVIDRSSRTSEPALTSARCRRPT